MWRILGIIGTRFCLPVAIGITAGIVGKYIYDAYFRDSARTKAATRSGKVMRVAA